VNISWARVREKVKSSKIMSQVTLFEDIFEVIELNPEVNIIDICYISYNSL